MNLLSPAVSSRLAATVYGVEENPLLSARRRLDSLNRDGFTVSPPANRATRPYMRGVSGAAPGGFRLFGGTPAGRAVINMFTPVESNFGYVGMGSSREWERHMIVVTRGTMGPQGVSPDWLSNFNVGLQPGPGGFPVHAGFNRIWGGFTQFVRDAVSQYRPAYIHCIGHSLGGALASLNALMLARAGHQVALYTFGAPRVGTMGFATDLSLRLGIQAKRVYHPADPVPMIPLLPFIHAPLTAGIRLVAPAGALVDATAHDRFESYHRRVGNQSWSALEGANTVLGDFQIDSWLQQAARHRGGFMMRSAALLERIARGLARLVAKAAIYVIGSGITAAISATLTTLDFIAWLLARAAEMAVAIRDEIVGLVNAIFGFLGRVANSIESLTQRALRWVLDLLFSFLSSVAHNALDRLR